ncbi:M1 family aminopeptidase [Actinomadura keratinilytica]
MGPYPFETYGLLVADAETGFALETQTLSLFEKNLFTHGGADRTGTESIMVHELAHQWFGDSVSPAAWSDLWISEAHATWYEALWAEEHGGPALEERMRRAHRDSDGWRAAGARARPKAPEPGEKISLFRPVVYDGSALVLYALRQEIGEAAFGRSSGSGSASTATPTPPPPTSSPSPPAPPDATSPPSSRAGCTASGPRPCPATRTGARRPPEQPVPPRRGDHPDAYGKVG